MISRILIIVLAFGAAAYRANQAAWVAAAGLAALGVGLSILHFAPKLKWLAWVSFAVTAGSMLMVYLQRVP